MNTRVHFANGEFHEGAPSTTQPAADPNVALDISVRTNSAQRWTPGGGEAELPRAKYNTWRAEPLNPEVVGIAATLETKYGDKRVTVPGIGVTTADVAVRMGLVRWQGDTLVDMGSPQQQGQQATQQPEAEAEPTDPGAGAFTAADDAAIQAIAEPIGQAQWDRAVSSVVSSVLSRDGDLTFTARQLAEAESSAGRPMTPEQGQVVAEAIVQHALKAGTNAVRPILGYSQDRLDQFMAHLETDRATFGSSLQTLLTGRDPSRLREAASKWAMVNPDPMVAEMQKHGYEFDTDATGTRLTRPPGSKSFTPLYAWLATMAGQK